MSKVLDRSGIKYGKLMAVSIDRIVYKQGTYWLCVCECGNETVVRGNMLGKQTNSCGCLKVEQNKKNLGRFVNGNMKSRLAGIWYHIKGRCYNEKDSNYKNYGALGIEVYKEWLEDYLEFEKWSLLNGYSDELSIDRINPKGNYEPGNCRWANQETQSNNKRNTLFVEFEGKIISLKQAYYLIEPEITYQTAKTRYHKGERDVSELFAKNRRYRGN